jgi:hypothetical protein
MGTKPKKPPYEKIFPREYWDRPDPLKDHGPNRVEDVYQAVGYALNYWELAEEEMATLFLVLSEPTAQAQFLQ